MTTEGIFFFLALADFHITQQGQDFSHKNTEY